MTETTPTRCPVPHRMRSLPIEEQRGLPVPWFVAWIDGKPIFPIMDGPKVRKAARERRCWVCGKMIHGTRAAYVIGPMCVVNRTTAEPPSHLECALYSAQECPFLSKPHMKRRAHLPDGVVNPAGTMIKRNPGACVVWVIDGPTRVFDDGRGGWLFDIDKPAETHWFAEGRPATRAEIMESIDSGMPLLRAAAEEDDARGDKGALAALQRQYEAAIELLPEA